MKQPPMGDVKVLLRFMSKFPDFLTKFVTGRGKGQQWPFLALRNIRMTP